MSELAYGEQYYQEDALHAELPAGSPAAYAWHGRAGLLDWSLALYVLAVAALQGTAWWRYSTYIAYGVFVLFFLQFRLGHSERMPELWLFAGLAVWTVITMAFSDYVVQSRGTTWYRSKVYVMGLIFLIRIDSVGKARLCLRMLFLGAAFLTLASAFIGFATTPGSGERAVGIATQANRFGYTLSDGILVGLILLPMVGRLWKSAIMLYFCIAGIALLASGSRSSALAASSGIVAFFVLEHVRNIRANLKIILPVALAIAAVPVIAVTYFPYSPLVVRTMALLGGDIATVRARMWMYSHAWSVFLDHPLLGIGPGTYYFYTGGKFVYTHTTPMELLAGGGIIMFLLFYITLLVTWLRLGKLVRVLRHERRMRRFINGFRAAIVGLMVHGFFRVMTSGKVPIILFCLMAGLSARLMQALREEHSAGMATETTYEPAAS